MKYYLQYIGLYRIDFIVALIPPRSVIDKNGYYHYCTQSRGKKTAQKHDYKLVMKVVLLLTTFRN